MQLYTHLSSISRIPGEIEIPQTLLHFQIWFDHTFIGIFCFLLFVVFEKVIPTNILPKHFVSWLRRCCREEGWLARERRGVVAKVFRHGFRDHSVSKSKFQIQTYRVRPSAMLFFYHESCGKVLEGSWSVRCLCCVIAWQRCDVENRHGHHMMQ